MNPLVRYVLQQKLTTQDRSIRLITCEDIKTNNYDGPQNRIIYPTEIIQTLPMQINGGLYLDVIMQQPITITFPLLCINNVLVNDIRWSQLINDSSPDYSVGNLEFKYLFLQAECDVYGFIFLSCVDIHGNRLIVKL